MKRLTLAILTALLLTASAAALADTHRLAPSKPVPDHVTWLLETAAQEVGYAEGAHGYTKYGEWSGDPYAQWCAEFLCWCVDQVDQAHGTKLLGEVYPLYSGQNSGRDWFIRKGRYIVRWGNLEGWGYQWLKGEDHFISPGSYIPQPGDWVFFTWTSDTNTDHVALVEYCTADENGNVTVHVIEGNTPDSVKRTEYALTYKRILGFGTVRDCADWTMRGGNSGEKVSQLQAKLAYLGYLSGTGAGGVYGAGTVEAVKAFQRDHGLRDDGIANIHTQLALNSVYEDRCMTDPEVWRVDAGYVNDERFSMDDLDDFADWDEIPVEDEEEEDLVLVVPQPDVGVDENDDSVIPDLTDEQPDWFD